MTSTLTTSPDIVRGQSFSDAVYYLAAKTYAVYTDCFIPETVSGVKVHFMDQWGTVSALVPKETRHAATPILDVQKDRRKVTPKTLHGATLIDRDDKAETLYDPAGPIAVRLAQQVANAHDNLFRDAFFATAYSGEDGSTANTWAGDTTSDVAVNFGGTNIGMTIDKLIEARRMMGRNRVMLNQEQLYCAVTSNQQRDMVVIERLQNSQYATGVNVLVNGAVDMFLKIQFITDEDLTLASTSRYCPFWCKSGMGLTTWADGRFSRTTEDPDHSYSLQMYESFKEGAVRLEEVKVIRIVAYDA